MNAKKSVVAVLTLMLLLLLPNIALGHSTLESTVPAERSDKEVSEIKLTFNAGIEPVSKVIVTNESGVEQPLQDIKVNGKVMTAVFEKPLTNGIYTVEWKIISEDGHPLTGTYSLEITIPEPTPEQTTEPVSSQSAQPTLPSASASAIAESDSVQTEEEEGEDIDVSVVVLIGAAVLLAAAVIGALLKKAKR